MNNIAVIGAGMSGLCFGILAHHNNTNIDIYERHDVAGKKILLTGNGKCNLNNNVMNESCYYSDNKEFVHNFFSVYDNKEAFNFYKELGLIVKANNEYIYPVSNQASTVVNLLVQENIRLGNTFNLGTFIDNIMQRDNKYVINNKAYDYVIISSGGMAGIYRENEYNAYRMLKKLNITVKRAYPALTRIIADSKYNPNLKGIRLDGTVSLYSDNTLLSTETGEIQFTDKGVSGIAIFQLSLYLGKILDSKNNDKENKPYILIDFLNNMSINDFRCFIENSMKNNNSKTVKQFLDGISNNKLNDHIIEQIKIKGNQPLSSINNTDIEKIINAYKSFKINVTSLDTFKNAQVSNGGVSLDCIDDNFQSKQYKNLYMIGEVLDFTGKCGGYNLAFAYASAHKAAKDILKYVSN